VGQGTDNVYTVLGQYIHFMQDHNEKHLLITGSYEVLTAFPRVYAFLKFLQLWGYRSVTVRNKAAVLKGCLKHLQTLPTFSPGTLAYTRLMDSMKTCERWRSNMKIKSKTEQPNEEKLIVEGKFFQPPEDLAFFRWLIRKIHNDMVKNVRKINILESVNTSLWTLKTMTDCQPYWIALVHMCLGGQRLQVTAGMKMDCITWTSSGQELVLQTEKTSRVNMEGLPVPEQLQMYSILDECPESIDHCVDFL